MSMSLMFMVISLPKYITHVPRGLVQENVQHNQSRAVIRLLVIIYDTRSVFPPRPIALEVQPSLSSNTLYREI